MHPHSGHSVQGPISVKHQFFYPAIISAIIICVNPFNNQITRSLKKSRYPALAMVSESESYTTGCMIRECHIYKDIWSNYVRELLYCCLLKEVQKGLLFSEA